MEPVRLPDVADRFLDRWVIEGIVGRGGFSVVYRAVDDDGQLAAVKVLTPKSASKVTSSSYDSEIADRFLREARLLDQLDSPYTIHLSDYGESPDNLLYMVFEFIDGRMLFDEIKEHGALETERVIHILRQTLIALECAHGHGILHRDIKPNNIMLYEHDGDPDRVKLVDFGIAKLFDDDKDLPGNDLTAAGLLVGTPRYMSPEQLRGQDLVPAADLYSLGLCAIEMLSGRKCIPGKDRVKIVERQLGPEQVRIPDDIETDPALAAIVHRLTQKKVPDRYPTATAVLRDLEALAGDPGANGDTLYQTVPADLGALLQKPTGDNDDTVFETVNTAELAALIAEQRAAAGLDVAPATDEPVSEGSIDPFGDTMASREMVPPDFQAQLALLRATDSTVEGPPAEQPSPFGAIGNGFGASFDPNVGDAPDIAPAARSWDDGMFPKQPPAANQFPPPPSPAGQSYGSGQFQQPPPAGQSYGGPPVPQHQPPPPAGQAYGSGQFQQPPPGQAYGSGQFAPPPMGAYGSGQFQQLPPDPNYGSGQYQQPGYPGPPGYAHLPPGHPGHHPPGPYNPGPPPQQFRPKLTGDDKLALGAACIVPGVGQIIAGQVVKGVIIMVVLLLLVVFASWVAWLVFIPVSFADTFLLVRAQKRRPVGSYEFFADYADLL